MNSNLKQDLLHEYERLLKQAEADRACIIKYASTLSSEQCAKFTQKADSDIYFAKRKILELSLPPIPLPETAVPETAVPETAKPDTMPELKIVMDTPVTGSPGSPGSPDSSGPDYAWWIAGAVIGGLIAAPFVAGWIAKDPPKNLQTVQNVMKTINKVSRLGHP